MTIRRLLSVVALGAVCAGCSSPEVGSNPVVLAYLEGALWLPAQNGRVVCAYEPLAMDRAAGEQYVWARCDELTDSLDPVGGTSGPLLLRFADGMLVSHEAPRDGAAYTDDLARLFPPEALDALGGARAHNRRAERLGERIVAQVEENGGL